MRSSPSKSRAFIPHSLVQLLLSYVHYSILLSCKKKERGRRRRRGTSVWQHSKQAQCNGNYSPKSLYVVAISPVPHHFVPGIIPLNTENGLFFPNVNVLLVSSSFAIFVLRRWFRFIFCFSTISHWFIRLSISLNWISNGRFIFDSCFSNFFPAFSLLRNK